MWCFIVKKPQETMDEILTTIRIRYMDVDVNSFTSVTAITNGSCLITIGNQIRHAVHSGQLSYTVHPLP